MHMALSGSAVFLVLSAIVYALNYAWAEFIKEEAAQQDAASACKYGEWQAVGVCSVTCGSGVQQLKRFPGEQNESCQIQSTERPCEASSCPRNCEGQWGAWGPCKQNCTQLRQYRIVRPETNGGRACSEKDRAIQSTACSDGECSIDCSVGSWNAIGNCTRPCGGGEQMYHRPVLQVRVGRGQACPALEKREACNAQDCAYPKILAKLRVVIQNFSSGEPVMDVVRSEADGFKSLAKTSHSDDPQGKEWGMFVDNVRALARDYNQGKKKLYQALLKLMTLSRQAPDELEALFQEFLAKDWALARRRFNRFLHKVSSIHQMIDEVHNSFMEMEKAAELHREKAVDQQETFTDIAAAVRRLGVSGESVDFSGFAVENGVDHRGADIACGKFTSIHALASQCLHDSSCQAFTVWNGKPWCLKHLRFDDGPVSDGTHIFYRKLVQSGGVVQTEERVEVFLKRWSFAASLLMTVENTINRVAEKVGSIETELNEMGMILAELEGLLGVDQEVQHRVEELLHDIASAFTTIVACLEPSMK